MNARPEYEVARETLVGLMTRHAIVAQVTQTPSGITQDESGWAHREWRFSLRIGGETILANAPYRAGTGIAPESLRDVDLVAAVLTDAAIAAPYEDLPADDAWVACADDLGAFEADAIAHARRRKDSLSGVSSGLAEYIRQQRETYRECLARLHLIREAVGAEACEELLAVAGRL
jgi:hypothetical protein